MHHVASFLLSRITKLADVSPSNVESNLSERYIRMRNLKLREDTAADIIHLPVESGSIGELHFDLPWPLSSDPLVINVKDVSVSVLTCQPTAAADCPLDEVAIRSGITEETILGIGVNSALSRRTSSTRSQGSSLTPFKGIEIEEDTGTRGSWNEDENNGYMSCRSDGGSSSTCTEAEMDDSPLPNQRGGSVLSYVRDFFSSSMSWMFNRTVVVTLVGINIVFRPTTSCTEGFEVFARNIKLHVNPCQQADAQQIKVLSAKIEDIAVRASKNSENSTVATVRSANITITSVYTYFGTLCRKNITVTSDSDIFLFLHSDVLNVLSKYMAQHCLMQELPPYCRPFIHLHGSRSRWEYARCCVLELVRDRRTRYNYSVSYLKQYSQARRRYLDLLEQCHREGDVDGRLDEMVEAEKFLRFRDVVKLLRRKVMQEHACAMPSSPPAGGDREVEGAGSLVMVSTHVDINKLCLNFTSEATVVLSDIAFVKRLDETNLKIADICVGGNDISETVLFVKETDAPLLCFRRQSNKGAALVTVSLEPVRIAVTSPKILEVLHPAAEVLTTLVADCLELFSDPKAPSRANTTQSTTSLVLPRVSFSAGDICFKCEKLSLTAAATESCNNNPRFAVTLHELSVRQNGETEYILSPISVTMDRDNNTVISTVKLQVPSSFWKQLQRFNSEWHAAVKRIYVSCKRIIQTRRGAVAAVKPKSTTFDDMWKFSSECVASDMLQLIHKIHIKGINVTIEQAKSTLTLDHVAVSWYKFFRGKSLYSLHIKSTTFHLGTVADSPLEISIPCSTDIHFSPEWQNGSPFTSVSFAMAEAFMRPFSPDPLLAVFGFRLSHTRSIAHCSLERLFILGAVELAPLRFCFRPNPSAEPSPVSPYVASYVQTYLSIVGIRVDVLCAVKMEQLTASLSKLRDYFVENTFSKDGYSAFMNGYSDIAVALCSTTCVLSFGKVGVLRYRVETPVVSGDTAQHALENHFGELLPEIRCASPASVVHNCETLSMVLHIPLLYLVVSHVRLPSVAVKLNVRQLKASLPFKHRTSHKSGVTEAKALPSPLVSVRSLRVDVEEVIAIRLVEISLDCSSESLTNLLEGVWSDEKSMDDLHRSEEPIYAIFDVRNILFDAVIFGGTSCRRRICESLTGVKRMVDSLRKHIVMTEKNIRGVEYNLDDVGTCFFNKPNHVISVEDCAFISGKTAERIVVCKGTHVYFNRCRFSGAQHDIISVEDNSATFVCVDCDEIVEHFSDLAEASPNDSTVEGMTSWWPNTKLLVNINRISGKLSLPQRLHLTMELSPVDTRLVINKDTTALCFDIPNARCGVILDGVVSRFVTGASVALEVNCARRGKKKVFNAALCPGLVAMPVEVARVLLQVIERWDISRVPPGEQALSPVSLQKQLNSLFKKCRCSLAISAFPLELSLCNGEPFVHITLQDFLACFKQVDGKGLLSDVKLGVHTLKIWEFSSHGYKAALQKPFTLLATVKSLDLCHIACEISLSAFDIVLSSEQLKCVRSLWVPRNSNESDRKVKTFPSVEVLNQLGVPVTLTLGCGEIVNIVGGHYALWGRMVVASRHITAIDGRKVTWINTCMESPQKESVTDLLHVIDLFVAENGEEIHVSTKVFHGSLSQQVIVRTTFLVMNTLPCVVACRANGCGTVDAMFPPGTVTSFPIPLLDKSDVLIRLISPETGAESNEQIIGEDSLRDLKRFAEIRGDDSIGRLREFIFSGEKVYVDITYRLQDAVLTMFLSPVRVGIHNGTRYQMGMSIFIAGQCVEESVVEPDGTFFTLRHDPFGPPVGYMFECVINSDTYISSELVDGRFTDGATEESVVMVHKDMPHRHFFELNIEQRCNNPWQTPRVFTLRPRYMFEIENKLSTDVRFTSEAGNSVGSLRDKVLSCVAGRNFAYLPLYTSLVVHVGSKASAPFEINDGLEGRLIVCTPTGSCNDCDRQCHCLLMRPTSTGCRMELLPSLYIVNEDERRNLVVMRCTERNGDACGKNDHATPAIIPARGTFPYTALLPQGGDEFFSFTWNDAGGACNGHQRVSPPLKVTLTPHSFSSSFVQCGNTHHEVRLRKDGFLDPAVLSVSGPCGPRLTVVNMTPYTFDTVLPMRAVSYTPQSINVGELYLVSFDSEGGRRTHHLQLPEEGHVDFGNDFTTLSCCQSDGKWLVTLLPAGELFSLKSSTVAAADAQGMREGVKTPLPQAPHTLLRVNVKLLQAQLVMRDGHDTPIHTTADRGELWVVYQSKKITAQCTASNVYSKGTYSGKLSHEIRPFSLDITVRDARVAAGTIHAFSIHAHVTTFEVQLSDTFVYQMQRLMRCLEGDSLPLEVDDTEITGEVITPALSSEWRLLNTSLRVDFLLISEVLVIFSYDRSVQPPEDVVFQGSHIGNIFPSIHEAAITLPRVQCKDFRGTSVAEVWNVMCEGVTMELLKQMPQVVSGFVLLPTFSPIKNVIDRIGSFIFRGSGSSPNPQGPLLI